MPTHSARLSTRDELEEFIASVERKTSERIVEVLTFADGAVIYTEKRKPKAQTRA